MQKTTLLGFFIVFLSVSARLYAQPPCGFDKLHNNLLTTDPSYARQIEQNDISIRQYIKAHPELLRRGSSSRTMALYTIPVVVHVMHTGGAVGTIYNPSDAQITGAINYLNQVFAGTYAGMTAPVEGGGVVDMEVQFGLAQRTPSCGATNGIDRVDASSLTNYMANGVNVNASSGCSELALKDLARWNTADYYNIWVVNKIDGADGTSGQFIAGFAYFPGSPSSLDGTIMLATQLVAGQKTLPHEIGHALNLYHPFQGSADNTQCPANATCSAQGDRICDTDPIFNNYNSGTGVYSFTCRSGANPCASSVPYTINTESNFMSYTNCYTLFTNDQKARAQAAMSLASRASLVAPGNLALVPCGTTINFYTGTVSQTEDITGTLTGCRRYKDYTYQMTIGTAPSATATAALTYSGTAIKGLDYDVTTNGNFASPSDVLTFNTGSAVAQNITIRLYDDANVESAETIILDFTVNNGGGDATKGVITPTFTLTLSDNDFVPAGTSSGTYSVGTLTTIITDPFDATQQSQRSQYLYKASELTAADISAGDITSIQLFIDSKLSTRPFTNFSIKMANTSVINLVDGSANVISGMTTVFTTASHTTTAGWNIFTLSTPFAWNGTSNLAIEICYDNSTADAGNAADEIGAYADGSTASQGNMFFKNNINCSGIFSGSISYYPSGVKPIIRLGVSIAGTPVETAASSTSSTHIVAGSNDYFYSNNNKLLLRLNSVNAALGCVSTVLDAGGTTWVNALGGQRSVKVFTVTPTTNIATTGYTISLYFDNTELAGKNPATLRMAKTTAASAASANSGNTILVTPAVTTLGSNTTVFTGSFTGFSRFFLTEGAVLPVALIDFTANLNGDQNTIVKWSTASEENNRQFDIELSSDGIHFTRLATVNSKGNSNMVQEYEYLHIRPATGTSWYRLKQIDWDDNFKYSRIVSVNINQGQIKPFVYPVPSNDMVAVNFGTVLTNAAIEILTSDMRAIRKEMVSGLAIKKDIAVGDLSAGIYFIRISTNINSQVIRFIKE